MHASEVLHNLVEAIIDLLRYPYLGNQLILQEIEPVCIIVSLFVASQTVNSHNSSINKSLAYF